MKRGRYLLVIMFVFVILLLTLVTVSAQQEEEKVFLATIKYIFSLNWLPDLITNREIKTAYGMCESDSDCSECHFCNLDTLMCESLVEGATIEQEGFDKGECLCSAGAVVCGAPPTEPPIEPPTELPLITQLPKTDCPSTEYTTCECIDYPNQKCREFKYSGDCVEGSYEMQGSCSDKKEYACEGNWEIKDVSPCFFESELATTMKQLNVFKAVIDAITWFFYLAVSSDETPSTETYQGKKKITYEFNTDSKNENCRDMEYKETINCKVKKEPEREENCVEIGESFEREIILENRGRFPIWVGVYIDANNFNLEDLNPDGFELEQTLKPEFIKKEKRYARIYLKGRSHKEPIIIKKLILKGSFTKEGEYIIHITKLKKVDNILEPFWKTTPPVPTEEQIAITVKKDCSIKPEEPTDNPLLVPIKPPTKPEKKTTLLYFWSNWCPHRKYVKETGILAGLEGKGYEVKLIEYPYSELGEYSESEKETIALINKYKVWGLPGFVIIYDYNGKDEKFKTLVGKDKIVDLERVLEYSDKYKGDFSGLTNVESNPKGEVCPTDTDDRDGDGVIDSKDCAPDDKTKWYYKKLYQDNDGDGYGDPKKGVQDICIGNKNPDGFSENNLDADDNNPNIGDPLMPPKGPVEYFPTPLSSREIMDPYTGKVPIVNLFTSGKGFITVARGSFWIGKWSWDKIPPGLSASEFYKYLKDTALKTITESTREMNSDQLKKVGLDSLQSMINGEYLKNYDPGLVFKQGDYNVLKGILDRVLKSSPFTKKIKENGQFRTIYIFPPGTRLSFIRDYYGNPTISLIINGKERGPFLITNPVEKELMGRLLRGGALSTYEYNLYGQKNPTDIPIIRIHQGYLKLKDYEARMKRAH